MACGWKRASDHPKVALPSVGIQTSHYKEPTKLTANTFRLQIENVRLTKKIHVAIKEMKSHTDLGLTEEGVHEYCSTRG